MWAGNHTMKTGASFTYDVTEQLFQPLQNGRYTFAGAPNVAPNPIQYAVVRIGPRGAADVPEGVRDRRLLPGRLARAQQPDAQSRPALRRRDHQGHPGLAGRHRCQQLRSAHRLRLGSRAIRDGPSAAASALHAAAPIFTIVKGGVGGGTGHSQFDASRSLFPTFPNTLPAFPPGAAAGAQHPGDFARPGERARVDGEHRLPAATRHSTSVAVDANINRGVKHGFLDMNAPVPISRTCSTRRSAPIPMPSSAPLRRPIWPRPIVPVNNGFRHMDLLTNEGAPGIRACASPLSTGPRRSS